MKLILTFCLSLFLFSTIHAQENPVASHLRGKISYPALNVHPFTGVIKTDSTVLRYDPMIEYKVVLDVYEKIQDSTQISNALREVARTYNLIVANGAPEDLVEMAVVIHGYAIDALLNNVAYKEKFGRINPNARAVKALKEKGIHFYVCGQNLGMFNIPKSNLLPEIEVALSAKTALITLDQMGYSYLNVNGSE